MAHNPMATKFEDHPGHDVHDCPLKEAVHPHPMGTSQRGYRCSVTGGHCVPDNNCQSKIISYYEEEENEEIERLQRERNELQKRLNNFVRDCGTTMSACPECGHGMSSRTGCLHCQRDKLRGERDELHKVVKELADQEIHENDLDVSYVRTGLIEKARRALGGE
jgi:hypothetical protein